MRGVVEDRNGGCGKNGGLGRTSKNVLRNYAVIIKYTNMHLFEKSGEAIRI